MPSRGRRATRYSELHLRFMETARTLGLRDAVAMPQFNLLGHFVALFGKRSEPYDETVGADCRAIGCVHLGSAGSPVGAG